MVDTISQSQQVFLTYSDVKENNPQWSEKMIEDYLALKRDLTRVSDTTDTTFDSSYFDTIVGQLADRIEDLEQSFSDAMSLANAERIEELERTEADPMALLALNQIDAMAFEVVAVSADYATSGNQIIICTNTTPITITLNADPEDTEQVHVVRQNTGGVTISGTINSQTSLVIGQRYSSPHLVYTVDGGEWSII